MVFVASDANRWFNTVAPGTGLSVLSKGAGFSRIRILQQMADDRVKEETIIGVSRALHLDPLEQLRTFPGYESLAPSRPEPREVDAFIRWEHLLRACAALELGDPVTDSSLGPTFFRGTSRQWVDSIDPDRGLRKHLQQYGPVTSQGLSSMLNGPLRIDLALLAAKYAGVPQVSALVASQLLTPAEAGWDAEERVQWLHGLGKVERLHLVKGRIHTAIVREQQTRDPVPR
ncbi:hypothetical protein [Paeniglutamicibacter kerguelensis]